MTIITGFINIEVGACLVAIGDTLARAEDRLHKLGQDKQIDEQDKKAYSNALIRIQHVRNGLHG